MILSSSFESAMTFICNFRIAVPDPFFANFPNCRPGPFFFLQILEIVLPDHFLCKLFKLSSWIAFCCKFWKFLFKMPFCNFFKLLSRVFYCKILTLSFQITNFCKLSKNSLGPKTKNGLIFEFFFAKEVAVLKRVCDRKEEQVEMIAHFSFC